MSTHTRRMDQKVPDGEEKNLNPEEKELLRVLGLIKHRIEEIQAAEMVAGP